MRNEKGYPTNYVHWYRISDDGALSSRYESTLSKDIISNANNKKLQKAFKKTVAKTFNIGDPHILNTVLSFGADSIMRQNRSLKKSFEIAFQSIQSVALPKVSQEDINNELSKVQAISEDTSFFLERLGAAIELCVRTFSDAQIQQYYKYIYANTKDSKIRQNIINIFGSDFTSKPSFIQTNKLQNLNAGAQGIYKALKQAYEAMDENPLNLEPYLRSGNGYKFEKLQGYVNKFMGFVNEQVIVDVNNIVLNTVKHNVAKGQIKEVHYSGNQPQSSQDFYFKSPTTDVFYKTILKNGSSKTASLQMTVPIGATIKKSQDFSSKSSIHLKSGAKLENLIKASYNLGIFKRGTETAFHNVIANTGVKKWDLQGKQRIPYTYNNLSLLTDSLNKVFLVVGLAGSLTKDDLSTMLIVNDQVFDIYDILSYPQSYQLLSKSSGLQEYKILNITKKHKFRYTDGGKNRKFAKKNISKALERSSDIIQQIYKTRINLELRNINANKLRGIY